MIPKMKKSQWKSEKIMELGKVEKLGGYQVCSKVNHSYTMRFWELGFQQCKRIIDRNEIWRKRREFFLRKRERKWNESLSSHCCWLLTMQKKHYRKTQTSHRGLWSPLRKMGPTFLLKVERVWTTCLEHSLFQWNSK